MINTIFDLTLNILYNMCIGTTKKNDFKIYIALISSCKII